MTGQAALYDASGRLLGWASNEWLERNAGHLRLVRSRRAHRIMRAYLRQDDGALVEWLGQTGRRSSYGCAFEQKLPCGRRTWALRGTPGAQ